MHALLLLPLPLLLAVLPLPSLSQAPWSGNMHPAIGFPDGCDVTKGNDCSPTYSQLAAAGALWPCPAGAKAAGTCSADRCVPGSGSNPVCNGLNASSPCCCAKDGCYALPLFNTVRSNKRVN